MSGLGSYALVRSLYQKMKKKEVQDRLTAAQQGYVNVLDQSKGASVAPDGKPLGFPEGIFSAAPASAILLGLASAAVTNKMLNKTFPTTKSPARKDPRRVVIRTMDDPAVKAASIDITDADGEELVYRMLLSVKSAALRPYQDLICAIGQGRASEVAHGLTTYGIDTAEDMVKGASYDGLAEPYRSMAVGVAARSELLGPSLRLLTAGEFNEHFPSYFKIASSLPQREIDALCKVAGIMAIAIRHDETMPFESVFPDTGEGVELNKEAGQHLLGLLDDVLLAQTASNLTGIGKHDPHQKDQLTSDNTQSSDASDGSIGDRADQEKPQVIAGDMASKNFTQKNKDQIDAALAPE